jgi:hypothetical protein
MKVSEMPAGRELDALVAEKVMGWTLCDRVAMGWGDGPPVFATGEDPYDDTARPSRQDWRPSEDIAAAWEVVENWRNRCNGEGVVLLSWHSEEWVCELGIWGVESGFRHAPADTAPLAICRAALLAVGITDA